MENPYTGIPEYPACRRCAECHEEVADNEIMFEINSGYYVCEECFRQFLDEYAPASIADALNISFCKARDLNE